MHFVAYYVDRMYGVTHPTGMDVGRNTVASACLLVASSLPFEHHLDTCSQGRGLLPALSSCAPGIAPMKQVELNMSSCPMKQNVDRRRDRMRRRMRQSGLWRGDKKSGTRNKCICHIRYQTPIIISHMFTHSVSWRISGK